MTTDQHNTQAAHEPTDAQATPIPCALNVAGTTYPAGTPFCDVIDKVMTELEAARRGLAQPAAPIFQTDAVGQAIEALSRAREHVLVYTGGPFEKVDDQCMQAIEALKQARAAQPAAPLFTASIAARKWQELQADGHRMTLIRFDGGKGGPGSIDPGGVVMWGAQPAQQAREPMTGSGE